MSIGFFCFIILSMKVFLALITGLFAARKKRVPVLWAVTGAAAPIIALVGLAFFHSLDKIPPEEQDNSFKRAFIFCGILLLLSAWNTAHVLTAY